MHVAKEHLPLERLGDDYEARLADWGPYTAYFERIRAGTDFSAFYDTCQCPHLGYLFAGRLRFVYSDGHEEIVSAGEMYYIPPGHVFQVLEDAETVEFSPTGAYRLHMDRVAAKIAKSRTDNV
jgi:hypothetical protein